MLATTLGMVPPVLLYVYLGTLAVDMSQILSGDARPEGASWWIVLVTVVSIVMVLFVIQRTASKALAKHVNSSNE